jgi:hypothetical protein
MHTLGTKLVHRRNQWNMGAQEAPNSKLQAPEKNQTSNSKTERVRVSKFDAGNFSGAWCLVLGALGPVRFHWKCRRTTILFLSAIFLLGGCAHSPTVDVLGSYFPAWMLCIIVGLVSTLIVRLLLIGFGIYAHLRLKAVLFSCTAIFFTLAVWLVFFKN